MATQASGLDQFFWKPQPEAASLVSGLIESYCDDSPFARHLAAGMLAETGTRLTDWVDHLVVSALPEPEARLNEMGFEFLTQDHATLLQHPGGMFPLIAVDDSVPPRLAIKVESIVDFLFAQRLTDAARIRGGPLSRLRTALVEKGSRGEVWAVQRRGYRGFEVRDLDAHQLQAALCHCEAFQLRRREFESDAEGFEHAAQLIQAANRDLGVDLTCDLFFAAERRYWQRRNRAARVQKARQDKLGLGWANHDHHTYRSSREQFTNLIRLLELLGFKCRERFYGGRDAGWGAQVLEQPHCGIVIFADVDLAPDEVTGDFAHAGLAPRDQLGTVGLWCKLHGEAFLQAGMHHLECQFDFDAARRQLADEGVQTMAPFTDSPCLKQAFTQGEMWPVRAERIAAAVSQGYLTADQAAKFRESGSIGSHLEILERNDGYKGFNQTGISEIIRQTDPRHERV